MANNISKKHHYISQFYIKGFCDKQSGSLWFYDKKECKLFQNISSNIFYKKDMNTIVDSNGNKNDSIEKFQAELEGMVNSKIKDFVNLLPKIGPNSIIPKEYFETIIWFAFFTFWRNPQNDSIFNKIADKINGELIFGTINELHLIKPNSDELGNLLKRTLLSFILLLKKEVIDRIIKHSMIIGTEHSSLLNDYPMLCNSESTNFEYEYCGIQFKISDFIFPLSKNLTFVYSEHCDWTLINSLVDNNPQFQKTFAQFRDFAIFVNAERFVGCDDRNRIEAIANNCKNDNISNIFIFTLLKYPNEIMAKMQKK